MVDEVIIFDTPEELKQLYVKVKADVIVKGSEWTVDEVRSRDDIPKEIDIKVFPLFDELSLDPLKIKNL